jgi:hypothetical protein
MVMAGGFRWEQIIRFLKTNSHIGKLSESVFARVITSAIVVSQAMISKVRTVNSVLIFYPRIEVKPFCLLLLRHDKKVACNRFIFYH